MEIEDISGGKITLVMGGISFLYLKPTMLKYIIKKIKIFLSNKQVLWYIIKLYKRFISPFQHINYDIQEYWTISL